MKFFATAALVALVPTVLGLTVNTPTNVVVCQPIQFTWSDGTPPYFLSLVPGGQPSASAIEQFPTQQGTSYTWSPVTLPANTQFTVVLKDSTGTQAFSDIVTIESSSDTSCLNGSTSVVAGSTAAGSSGSATPTGSATSTPAGSSAKSSGTSSGTASSASASHSSSAARGTSVGAFGVAGLMGLVGAALF